MIKIKKLAIGIFGVILGTAFLFQNKDIKSSVIFAAETGSRQIKTAVDVSECRQGDTVTLSIYLDGSSMQDISGLNGTLEYDNRLFTVETTDFMPIENDLAQDWSFRPSDCTFAIQYKSGITIPDGGLLLQIKLHVAEDVPAGKTTVCVTHFGWQSSDFQKTAELEHRIPVQMMLKPLETLLGDVNGDGSINLTDAKLIMQYYNGIKELNSQQLQNADVNKDGSVSLTDAKLIMKYYNKEISKF